MIIIVVNFSHSHCRLDALPAWSMDLQTQMVLWMMLSIVWLVFAYVLVPSQFQSQSQYQSPFPLAPLHMAVARVLCQLFVWLTTKRSASCVLCPASCMAWLGLALLLLFQSTTMRRLSQHVVPIQELPYNCRSSSSLHKATTATAITGTTTTTINRKWKKKKTEEKTLNWKSRLMCLCVNFATLFVKLFNWLTISHSQQKSYLCRITRLSCVRILFFFTGFFSQFHANSSAWHGALDTPRCIRIRIRVPLAFSFSSCK